jgi:hypothetical protein
MGRLNALISAIRLAAVDVPVMSTRPLPSAYGCARKPRKRPMWFEGVGDFTATLTRRSWKALGYPLLAGRVVFAEDVSPLGVAAKVRDALDGTYYGGCVSVVLHGQQARDHFARARRCRKVQRRLRHKRHRVRQKRGW